MKPFETEREIMIACMVWRIASLWNCAEPKEVLWEWLSDGVPACAVNAIRRAFANPFPERSEIV